MTKLLATTGLTDENVTTNVTEIIDLENPDSKCDDYLPYPLSQGTYGAVGGLLANDKPLICGGINKYEQQKCFHLGNSTVQAETAERRYLSVAVVTSDGSALWATGGEFSKTTEYISVDGNADGPELPYDSHYFKSHCFLQLDLNTYMIVGGHSADGYLSDTFFYHMENQSFTTGPKLTGSHHGMSCGVIKTEDSGEKVVVVAGGVVDSQRNKAIETWTIGSSDTVFTKLNSTLPTDLTTASSIVTSDQKGMIVVGGYGFSSASSLDTLVKISCNTSIDCHVEEMEQKLRIPRRAHVAMLVPDSLVNCY